MNDECAKRIYAHKTTLKVEMTKIASHAGLFEYSRNGPH